MTQTGQISLTDCIYFQSYSVKRISCLMLSDVMKFVNTFGDVMKFENVEL